MERPENRVALVQVLGRDGQCLRSVDIFDWPLTLGRALDQQLVLDDPAIAPAHARLAPDADGRLVLTVGQTINGVGLQLDNGARKLLAAGESTTLPDHSSTLEMGHLRLVVRLPGHSLAPEQKVLAVTAAQQVTDDVLPASRLWVLGAVLMTWMLVQHAVSLDPGADFTAWLTALVGLPAAVMAWCAVWALLSKLFQHRFAFMAHLSVALPGLLLIEVLDAALPTVAASLGWPGLWRLGPPLRVLLMAWVLYRHLALLMPQQKHRAATAMAAAVVVGGAVSLAFTHRSTQRFSAPPYMSVLPLPMLNLSGTAPSAGLVQAMGGLADKVARRVEQAKDEEAPDLGED